MIQLTDSGRQALRLQDDVEKATRRIAELESTLRRVLLAGEQGGVDAALEREAWTVLNGEEEKAPSGPPELLERWAEQHKAAAAVRKALLADVAEEMRDVLCDALSALVMPTSEAGKAHTVARVRSVLAKVPGKEASHG